MSKKDNFYFLNKVLDSCETKDQFVNFENWIDKLEHNGDEFLTWIYLKGRLSQIDNLVKDE